MIARSAAKGCIEVGLTHDELVMFNNALNEICNGVRDLADDGEFQTRLGCERQELRALLEEVKGLLDLLEVSGEAAAQQ